MGIEPTLSAWEAEVLPLNYTRLTRLTIIRKAVKRVKFSPHVTQGLTLTSRISASLSCIKFQGMLTSKNPYILVKFLTAQTKSPNIINIGAFKRENSTD